MPRAPYENSAWAAQRDAPPIRYASRPGGKYNCTFMKQLLQRARAVQRTPEQRRALHDRLRPRAKVERTIAELMRRHGLRQGRYLGAAKTEFQALMTATMVDAERLLTVIAPDPARDLALRQVLTACSRPLRTRLFGLHQWFVFAPALPSGMKSAAS